MIHNQKTNTIQNISSSLYIYRFILILFSFTLSILLSSCGGGSKSSDTIVDNDPTLEDPTGTNTGTNNTNTVLNNLKIYLDNFLLNETSPIIRVEGISSGVSLKLRDGSCQGEILSTLDQDGTFGDLPSYEDYTEVQYYIEATYKGKIECQALERSYIHLLSPSISFNEEQTNLDKRKPQFNISDLFPGKQVKLSLYENDTCSGEAVSTLVNSSNNETTVVGVTNPLDDLDTHTYYVKQSYKDVSTCSPTGVDYAYILEMANLNLTYDDVILGGGNESVEVVKILPGSSVSLHKGSCENPADVTITEDGSLTPTVPNTYIDTTLYVKYSYEENSVCTEISRYIYLKKGVLSLNSAQTNLHKRLPTFNVTNLFPATEVSVALYESSTCTGETVSEISQTDTGSTVLTISQELNDNNTHTYYVKQSYEGLSSCSLGIEYTYGLNISDLTITSDPILYGSNPGDISVSGMLPGSTVSLHKGSCSAVADDSINQDGDLTPTAINSYIETDLYLKYSLNQGTSCESIGVKYLNLVAPVLALNTAQTNLDKRSPQFTVTSLFTGKNVAISIHESSDCSGDAVSEVVNSSTGSSNLGLASSLTDISSHTYSVKQSYLGYTSCSNSINYQYIIDIDNLTVSAPTTMYGTSPGSISVSKMLTGSTVSLHKGSCEAEVDTSISVDGTISPTVPGSYQEVALYLKYSFNTTTDCKALGSTYLYLEQPSAVVNEVETEGHKTTPTFSVTNLFTGKSVSVSLHEDSSCTDSALSSVVVSDTGSASVTLSSELEDEGSYVYYIKQSYSGYLTCSEAIAYQYSTRMLEYLSSLPEYNRSYRYGTDQNRGIVIKGTVLGNTIKVYNGDSCNDEEELLSTVLSTHDITFAHIPSITDGNHRFSFKELDPSSNVRGCFSTGLVNYKTPAIYSTTGAFAYKQGGSVTTYGDTSKGGNSSGVAASISSGVVHIYANNNAFAALKDDGSVVAWGNASYGGSTTSPINASSNLTSGVVDISYNQGAFAALKSNGSVVTWGSSGLGGNSSSVADSLSSGVVKVYANNSAFAALKSNGSVVTWGGAGGNSSAVAESLSSGVISVYATVQAFAALKDNGSVVTWGREDYGGSTSIPQDVSSQLTSGVVKLFSTDYAFAALKENGSVVAWGSNENGGSTSMPAGAAALLTSGVINIFRAQGAFAALKDDGSVVTWGHNNYGGNSSSVSASLSSGVVKVFSNDYTFAALKSNGSVVTWGGTSPNYGGDSSSVSASLSSGVVKVSSTQRAHAALKSDGSVVTWGDSSYGGSQGDASSFLDGTIKVIDIVGSNNSFLALREDGSVVMWGAYSYTPPEP